MKQIRLIPALCGLFLLAGCEQPVPEETTAPDLRYVKVSLTSASSYNFVAAGNLWYRTDADDAGKLNSENDAVVSADANKMLVASGVNSFDFTVPAVQYKSYASADKDLAAGMIAYADGAVEPNDFKSELLPVTAGIKINLYDSKFYARGERIDTVMFISDSKQAVSGTLKYSFAAGLGEEVSNQSSTVMVVWNSGDPESVISVGASSQAATVGMVVLPQASASGKFVVITDRNRYEFTKTGLKLTAGAVTVIGLDFASPDKQPTRIVGVIGDSISTFWGYMNTSYSQFYPASDAVSAGGTGTVQSVEKTYWWKVIYEKMSCGTLDRNLTNSWSGTRVITEGGVKGFVDRAYEFGDPDIILIHGGTNDMNQKTPMGNYDYDLPMGQLNDACYRSAYIKLIKMLQTRYPGVQLIVIVGDRLSYYEYNNTDPSLDYATSTINIANHFGLPIVDFTDGAKSYNGLPKSKGSHPDATGMQQMADKIYETCKDYLP